MAQTPSPADQARVVDLIRMINSGWRTQAVAVAAELGIADLLASGAGRADELAQAARCHVASVERLLRSLASLGLCEQRADGAFELTALGSLLRSDAPDSLRAFAIRGGRYQWPAWGKLLDSVRTGECARTLLDGTVGFQHLERDAAAAEIFHNAINALTRVVARALVGVYDFCGLQRIVDVGGGYGELLVAILGRCHSARGVLFDRPQTLDGAAAHLRRSGVAQRCELLAGDFFQSVPAGGDAYLLKSVLHDWSDEQSATILRSCRAAMRPDAKLLVVEQALPDRLRARLLDEDAARSDLNMLVMLGGRERTTGEFANLLESSGFRMERDVPITLNFRLMEALPA